MGYLRFLLGLWAAKLSIPLLKITKHNGTNFPGAVALKICPTFIQYVGKPKTIIGVTGTNGKTTVSNMLCDALEHRGVHLLHNRAGSNINTGIATSLVNGVNLLGHSTYDIAVFEIDERSSRTIFPYLTPTMLAVTNLFRDSMMRNAHPGFIADYLTKFIPADTKLLLNADDLLVCSLSPENERVYYGIARMDTDTTHCTNLINDLQICPICSHKLEFEYHRYHHIGRAHCPSCGFASPNYDYEASDVNVTAMTTTIAHAGESATFNLPNDSIFNIYNLVTVATILGELGIPLADASETLSQATVVSNRHSQYQLGDTKLMLQLAKEINPLAISRALDYITHFDGMKEIVIMMNNLDDVKIWSENIAWMYDCDFELLNQDNIRQIVVSGPRAKDYYFRLLIAGIPEEKMVFEADEVTAVTRLSRTAGDDVYILYGLDTIERVGEARDKLISLYKEDGIYEN